MIFGPKTDGTYLVGLRRPTAKGPFASIEHNEQRPHQGGKTPMQTFLGATKQKMINRRTP
jgi:hypothetical protein